MNDQRAIHRVIGEIREVLARFPHIDRGDVTLAFSGGKDSLTLAYAMRELGKEVRLKAVDMGYSPDWARRIHTIASTLKFNLEIVSVAEVIRLPRISDVVKADLNARRSFLNHLEANPNPNITPCTNCYNCKIVSLTQLAPSAGEVIYFGHHSDDMVASFIKNAVMYYDRWERGRVVFERENFIALLREIAVDFLDSSSAFLPLFISYLHDGLASTEEPIFERKALHGVDYSIARPLAYTNEETTRAFAESLNAKAESSGCGHTATLASKTPRELVQHVMLPTVMTSDIGRRNLIHLQREIVGCLKGDGSLQFDARATREIILGRSYKGGREDLQEKY